MLHHPRSFFPLELFQQVDGSVDLLWVLNGQAEDAAFSRLLQRLGGSLDISGMDLDDAAAALAAHRPDGIVSFVDDYLVTAAEIAARLGLPYHSPEVAATLADKRRQRDVLGRAGVAQPRFWSFGGEAPSARLEDLVGEMTFPVVLKPAFGSGSRGIRLVRSREELEEEVSHGPEAGWVVEAYLEDAPDIGSDFASYLSVESVVSRGRTSHVAITGRFPLASGFRETGNFIPVSLPPHLEAGVVTLADEALRALGIESGITHTEIKLTPDGPQLIEVNGRLGGRPPFVLKTVSDVNLFSLACQVAAGMPAELGGLAPCHDVGYWLMVQPPASATAVVAIDGLHNLSLLDGVDLVQVRRNPGEHVDWRQGTDSQVLTVRGTVPDHDRLVSTIRTIHETVAVRYLTTD